MPPRCHAGPPRICTNRCKAAYINLLLQVGFDTIDFGSFVSPKAIPQMRDTAEVLSKLDLATPAQTIGHYSKLPGREEAVIS
jgi:hydroxymethylglutaryl-CoA lyase